MPGVRQIQTVAGGAGDCGELFGVPVAVPGVRWLWASAGDLGGCSGCRICAGGFGCRVFLFLVADQFRDLLKLMEVGFDYCFFFEIGAGGFGSDAGLCW